MPLWEPAEISKLWDASYKYIRPKSKVLTLLSEWGGCVRWILEKPFEDSRDKLQRDVDSSTAENLLAACRGENDDNVRSFTRSVKLVSYKAREIEVQGKFCHCRFAAPPQEKCFTACHI